MGKKPRPHCRRCGKPLRMETSLDGKSGYGTEGNGYFCTQRCGYRWAVLWHKQQLDNKVMGEIGNG